MQLMTVEAESLESDPFKLLSLPPLTCLCKQFRYIKIYKEKRKKAYAGVMDAKLPSAYG